MTSAEGFPPGCALIEVHVAELKQIFNSLDPTPFRERDLDPKAEAALRRFILGLNDQLLMKIASVPVLVPEQQSVVKQLYKDQVRSRGGLDSIKLALEEAGTPFTPEQLTQIQPLFDDQDLARTQLQRESQGQPDPAKLAQIETGTLTKVMVQLSPAQRTALLASIRAKTQK